MSIRLAREAANLIVVVGIDPTVADSAQHRPLIVESNGVAQSNRLLEGVHGSVTVFEIRKIRLGIGQRIVEAGVSSRDRTSLKRGVAIPRETVGSEKQLVLERPRRETAVQNGVIAGD